MVVERQPNGKAKIVAREEVKTGGSDTHSDAHGQLTEQAALRDYLELDLSGDATSSKSTRGPAGKWFVLSIGMTAIDLETMSKELLLQALEGGKVQ